MNNFCGACGTPTTVAAKFCMSCGGALLQAVPIQYQQEPLALAASKPEKTSLIKNNWVYVAWFLVYFIFFSVVTAGVAIPLYVIMVILAFTPLAEKLWRWRDGLRPVGIQSFVSYISPTYGCYPVTSCGSIVPTVESISRARSWINQRDFNIVHIIDGVVISCSVEVIVCYGVLIKCSLVFRVIRAIRIIRLY